MSVLSQIIKHVQHSERNGCRKRAWRDICKGTQITLLVVRCVIWVIWDCCYLYLSLAFPNIPYKGLTLCLCWSFPGHEPAQPPPTVPCHGSVLRKTPCPKPGITFPDAKVSSTGRLQHDMQICSLSKQSWNKSGHELPTAQRHPHVLGYSAVLNGATSSCTVDSVEAPPIDFNDCWPAWCASVQQKTADSFE